jgi:hypothetical protein
MKAGYKWHAKIIKRLIENWADVCAQINCTAEAQRKNKKAENSSFSALNELWLGDRDSNPDNKIQNLASCR